MSVTKKDFIAIAQIIKGTSFYSGYSGCSRMTALRLADYFETQNAQFKREEFLKACGVTE